MAILMYLLFLYKFMTLSSLSANVAIVNMSNYPYDYGE
mgnify:CR=1 FL=1